MNIPTAELESFAAAGATSLEPLADVPAGVPRAPWPSRRRELPLSDAARRWLPTMKRRIVDRLSPERIVLFGSQVSGAARWDSDIDLLVVLSEIDDPRRVRLEIRRALRDIPIAKDIFVTTPGRAARFGAITGSLLHPALHEGATIYVRRDRDRFASEWLDDARADLAMAVGLLTLDDIEPWGIAFHAHQAVEKAFKAVLARAGSAVPRTHDLVDLAGRLPDRGTSPLDDDDLDRLTDDAVATRYPIDDWAAQLRPSRDEARRAVNDASKVIIEVDRHLTVPDTGRPDKSE